MATPRGYTELSSTDAADIEQVNVPLNDIDTDVGDLEGVVNALAGAWREHGTERTAYLASTNAGDTFYLTFPPEATAPQAALTANLEASFWLNPADYAVSGYDTEWRVRLEYGTNTVAPNRQIGVALHRAVITAGGSGFRPTVAVGTVVATGSSAAAVGASANSHAESPATVITTAARHLFSVEALGGAPAAGSITTVRASLQYRYVSS
jgi:hypothetical protein